MKSVNMHGLSMQMKVKLSFSIVNIHSWKNQEVANESLWRGAWQPTPIVLPGESHGQRRLAGYSPWDCKDLDTTKANQHSTAIKSCYLEISRQIPREIAKKKKNRESVVASCKYEVVFMQVEALWFICFLEQVLQNYMTILAVGTHNRVKNKESCSENNL